MKNDLVGRIRIESRMENYYDDINALISSVLDAVYDKSRYMGEYDKNNYMDGDFVWTMHEYRLLKSFCMQIKVYKDRRADDIVVSIFESELNKINSVSLKFIELCVLALVGKYGGDIKEFTSWDLKNFQDDYRVFSITITKVFDYYESHIGELLIKTICDLHYSDKCNYIVKFLYGGNGEDNLTMELQTLSGETISNIRFCSNEDNINVIFNIHHMDDCLGKNVINKCMVALANTYGQDMSGIDVY